MKAFNRRSFLQGTIVAGAAAGAALSLGAGRAMAAETRLRMTWWGSQERAKRTQDVAKLYEQKTPDIAIVGEPLSGDAYWTKLSTQMAGRNVSDVFQLEPSTVSDYSKRGACMALDPFIPKPLDVEAFGAKMLDLCRVDGKIYGVGLGLNSFSMFYDTTVFAKAGIPVPTPDTTWIQFAEMAAELTKAAGKDQLWGAAYGARYAYVLDVWLRQRGKSLFSPEGSIGFGVEDAKEWYAYWEDLRKKNICVSADLQTQDQNTIETSPLTRGNAVMGFTYSNQLIGYQAMMPNKLGITMVPALGKESPSGHYYRPALIWSIGATSKNGEAAAAFINFFVNDIEAGKILGVERGVPMSPKVREAILPQLNETERATVDYVNLLADKVSAYPPPAPVGSQQFDRDVVRKTADQVAFGNLSIDEAAQQLVDQGKSILRPK
ncbi:ABC transporter substrate-binding protein [Inquilinus sp. Marseille-Q2685]|uniref:ABC transporter substrate-binding protein n=1 Tax=Inquilinus sp. Marseille-Q2685 TaxID=2866581 RepID=UPI001CE40F6A|nr:ABC transporter substrate-binding protein [Inquilinus sp. Marseille-Q2685]